MRNLIYAAIIFGSVLVFTNPARAAQTFGCGGGTVPFCTYTGLVQQIYVNMGSQILIYFETPIDLSQPANVGYSGVTQASYALVIITENVEFANLFYSTALTAQATNRKVTFQMRGISGGGMKIDRIWLARD